MSNASCGDKRQRGELPRLALTIVREAGEPLATRTIAARALARKGITPDRRAMKRRRMQLQKLFAEWQGCGGIVKARSGKEAKRGLSIKP